MMNLTIYLTIVATVTIPVFSQVAPSSATLREKIREIEKGERQAILDLGKMADRSAIPYLQRLRQNEDGGQFGSISISAQMALAKLGDEKEMGQILSEANSDDPRLQERAVSKLAYVGGKEAIATLIGLLGIDKYRDQKGGEPNRRGPNGELPFERVIFEPLNLDAMKVLAQIVPNPPVDPKAKCRPEGKTHASRRVCVAKVVCSA